MAGIPGGLNVHFKALLQSSSTGWSYMVKRLMWTKFLIRETIWQHKGPPVLINTRLLCWCEYGELLQCGSCSHCSGSIIREVKSMAQVLCICVLPLPEMEAMLAWARAVLWMLTTWAGAYFGVSSIGNVIENHQIIELGVTQKVI